MICSVYCSQSVHSDRKDVFETELSVAQATGLEFIQMEDFNIGLNACSNSKFLNMLQIFDHTQFVQKPLPVTQASSTLIDYLYSSHPENITNCFVSTLSITDNFLILLHSQNQ